MKRLPPREAARLFFQFIDDELAQEEEKASQNATCFYEGCAEPPIKSHIISKKLLRRIAENGHVLTWPTPDTSLSGLYAAHDAGKSVTHLNMVPQLVGIGDVQITDPLFCKEHDKTVFKQIDDGNKDIAARSANIPKQVLLLSYRALCSLSFYLSRRQLPIEIILKFAKMVGYKHSWSQAENYARVHRLMAKETMLAVYERYEQIRKSKDYSQLTYSLYVVNAPPCIATTYSLIPADNDEVRSMLSGTLLFSPEDVVNFIFLPHQPLNSSICIISWLKGSQRGQRFISVNRINELSEKEQLEAFFARAFESPTVYISPHWWNSLSGVKRVEYAQIHFNAARDHAALI